MCVSTSVKVGVREKKFFFHCQQTTMKIAIGDIVSVPARHFPAGFQKRFNAEPNYLIECVIKQNADSRTSKKWVVGWENQPGTYTLDEKHLQKESAASSSSAVSDSDEPEELSEEEMDEDDDYIPDSDGEAEVKEKTPSRPKKPLPAPGALFIHSLSSKLSYIEY